MSELSPEIPLEKIFINFVTEIREVIVTVECENCHPTYSQKLEDTAVAVPISTAPKCVGKCCRGRCYCVVEVRRLCTFCDRNGRCKNRTGVCGLESSG